MGDFDLTDRIVVARATQGLPVIDPSDELLKVLLESGAVAAGETADAALTHAVAEAIERWSGAPHDIASNKRRASVLEMGRVPHVHPSQIQLNVPTAARPALPPDLPIDWIAGTSLVAANQIWIPAGSTWLSGTFETDTSFFATTSNGLAAGATRDHATLSALLELIERDAVAIWWYNQLPRPQIDVGSVGGSLVQAASAALARVGRHLWLLDLTFDLGVPVVAAISQRKDQTCEAIAIGFGAALTVEKAVRKSILELWPSVCADPNTTGKASEQLGASRQATRWRETGRLDDWPALVPADAGCRYPVSTKPEHDPSDGIAQVTECLAANGVQPTVVDLTVPAIQVPVVRVVAPGLRPWQPHFAPGRLCQIPVSLGLLDQPKSPGQLAPPPFW